MTELRKQDVEVTSQERLKVEHTRMVQSVETHMENRVLKA